MLAKNKHSNFLATSVKYDSLWLRQEPQPQGAEPERGFNQVGFMLTFKH
jgi:hypothetical protein